MNSSKLSTTVYWVTTLLFSLAMAGGGIAELVRAPKAVELMNHLGYPLYLLSILGVAKLLGAAAIVTNRFPRLKEWAYAGFTFNLVGAVVSHLAAGDGTKAINPVPPMIALTVSYLVWKRRAASKAERTEVREIRPRAQISVNPAAGL